MMRLPPPTVDNVSMTVAPPSVKCPLTSTHRNNTYDDINAYHSVTQSHAIIYIVVILALYFSALMVLIVRYMRNERNQMRLPYLHPAVLLGKKDRLARGAGDRSEPDLNQLCTVSTAANLSPQRQASPQLQLLLPQPQMDTAV